MHNHTGQIQDIIALCIELTEAKKGHFFCQYSGHINWLEVHAYPQDANFMGVSRMPIKGLGIKDAVIRLNEPEANEQLEALIKKLEEML